MFLNKAYLVRNFACIVSNDSTRLSTSCSLLRITHLCRFDIHKHESRVKYKEKNKENKEKLDNDNDYRNRLPFLY